LSCDGDTKENDAEGTGIIRGKTIRLVDAP
jgi:hypothetical protein